ncbi:unnamed protein product [Brassicogethes aeneus]|uniref:Uncharacterized protein n=1 Tax=Brassicogethes aeneus TaxID=1431903 RepID=A0A9P0FMF0_BRAAE|nr:unnamed protein product [Brassicogethes aeneus]
MPDPDPPVTTQVNNAPVYQIPAPKPFSFKASDWDQWHLRFQRFRTASGLNQKVGDEQVNSLIYLMGPQAESIFESFKLSGEDASGGKRDVQITNALIYMVCKDNAPHSIVEKEGFLHFTRTIAPLYKPPSRNTVSF